MQLEKTRTWWGNGSTEIKKKNMVEEMDLLKSRRKHEL
jgi:hypothetical protein